MAAGSGERVYKYLLRKVCRDKTMTDDCARAQKSVTRRNCNIGVLVDTLEPRLLFSAEHPLGIAVSASDYLEHDRALHDAQIASASQDLIDLLGRETAYPERSEIGLESPEVQEIQPRAASMETPIVLADTSGLMANDDVSLVIIEVTTTDDEYDVASDMSSVESFYNDVGGAGVSLREAITVANNDSSVDIIQLGVGEYLLDREGPENNEDLNVDGDLDILGHFHIQGVSTTDTVIKQSVAEQRILEVKVPDSVGGNSDFFSLANLTMTQSDGILAGPNGGAILSELGSSVYIDDVVITGFETAGVGGAIYANGELFLSEVTLSNNHAEKGGAIYSDPSSDVHIYNSVIANNTAQDDGGGLYIAGNLEVDSTLFDSNRNVESDWLTNLGGALFLADSATSTITDSVFKGNFSEDHGGAIVNLGDMKLSDSLVFDNAADGFGGGVFNSNSGTAELMRVSFVDNRSGHAGMDSETSGGALFNGVDASLNLASSIIAGNTSQSGTAGLLLRGSATITDSIIVDNVSEAFASEDVSGGVAFIDNEDDANDGLIISNSLIANNYVEVASGQGTETGVANDLEWFSNTTSNVDVSAGNNLIETSTNITTQPTDFTNVDPELIDITFTNTDPVAYDISISIEPTSPILNNGSVSTAGQTSATGDELDLTPDIGGYAFDSIAGMVFWSDDGGSIYRTGSTFAFAKSFEIVSGTGSILDIQIDPDNQRIYWLDSDNYEIQSAFLDGSDKQTEHLVDTEAVAFALDMVNDRFYVSTQGSTSKLIQYVTTDSHATEVEEREGDVIPIGSYELADIVLGADDVLYALDVLTTGEHSLIAVETLTVDNVADPTRGVDVLVTGAGNVDFPSALAIDRNSNTVYWTEPGDGEISSYTAGAVNTYAGLSDPSEPHEIAHDSLNDNLLITGNDADIYSLASDLSGTHSTFDASEQVTELAFSSVESTSQSAVNSAPVEDTNTGLEVVESSQILVNSDALLFTSDSSNSNNLTYTRTDSSAEINIFRLDQLVTEFTQKDILYDYIRFVHNGEHAGSEENWVVALEFDVSDEDDVITEATVNVTVTGVNDTPTLLTREALSVAYNRVSVLTEDILSATDEEDDDSTLTFEIIDVTYGEFTLDGSITSVFTKQDIVDGKVSFTHNGLNPVGNYTIDGVRVMDSDSSVSEGSMMLTVLAADPTYSFSGSLDVNEGGSVVLDNSYFNVEDPDTDPENVMFTVFDSAESQILLDNLPSNTFSLKDLNESRVAYRHSGAEPSADAFIQFDLSDEQSVERLDAMNISVMGVNDPPVLLLAASYTVTENEAGAVLAENIASDPDQDDVLVFIVSDSRFEVLDGNLKLKDDVSLNFEDNDTISFDVTVTDSSNETVTETVTVNVSDANDRPVLNLQTSYAVEENQPGVVLDTGIASDEDNGQFLSYTVSDDRFEIINGQLQLKPNIALDHESETTIELVVTVTDDSQAVNDTVSETITVNVSDANDRPVFNLQASYTVEENQPGVVLDTGIASDEDNGQSLSYTVSDDRFEIINGQLQLKPDTALDHEAETTIELVVTVSDDSQAANDTVSETITVNVSDANDRPVLNLQASYAVEENQPGLVLDTGIASDEDNGQSLSYTVSDDRFEIISGQLQLKPNIALDHEAETTIELVVTVSDDSQAANDTVSETVTVNVSDANDSPVLNLATSYTVEENTEGVILATDIVSDQDSSDALEFNVTDNRFEVFAGNLRLKTGAMLDYENSDPIIFDVNVYDNAGEEDNVTVTISVSDANDAPVVIPASSYAVDENASGAVVGNIDINDQDVDDVLQISVSDERFVVTESQIKLADGVALDFEEESTIDILVSAQDSKEETSIANATISVNDVNDIPEVDQQIAEQVLDVESSINLQIGTFIDQDGDTLTYNLTLANGSALPDWIRFESSTGIIALGSEPVTEVAEVLLLTATDGEGASVEVEFEVRFKPEPVAAEAVAIVNSTFEIPDTEIFVNVDPEDSDLLEVIGESATGEGTAGLESTTALMANSIAVDGTDFNEGSEVANILSGLFDGSSVDIFKNSQDDMPVDNVLRDNVISEFLARDSKENPVGTESLIGNGLFDNTVNIAALFAAMVQDAPEMYSSLSQSFEEQQEGIQEQQYAIRAVFGSSAGVTSGLSVGYILYLLRGGALLSSVLSSLPAWRFVDPLPILSSLDGSLDSDEESLQSLVAAKKAG